MLSAISETNIRKKNSPVMLNQKLSSRNNKSVKFTKANTSSRPPRTKKFNLVGTNNQEFLYRLKKRQQLNSLKEKSNKVSAFMNNFEKSYKSININLNSLHNSAMIANLAKINFQKSIMVRHKLRNLDKMNEEFDREYYKFGLNLDSQSRKMYEDKVDLEYQKRIKRENQIRKEKFKAESIKIMNILFKNNNEEGGSFSDYKKNKKLNELKSSINYICGTDPKKRKSQNSHNTISHYNEVIKSPSFIREKNKNSNFTPSVRYDKSNIFFSKKYELVQDMMDKDKKCIDQIFSTIQVSPLKKKKRKYKMKIKNPIFKTELNESQKDSTNNKDSPIRITEVLKVAKTISNENENEKNYSEKNVIKNTKMQSTKNIINDKLNSETVFTHRVRNKKFMTNSPKKNRHPSSDSNLDLPPKFFSTKKEKENKKEKKNEKETEKKKRCQTANNISRSKNFMKDIYNISKSKGKKKIYPLLMDLLDDNYKLKEDLKLGFNIITNMINDFKKTKKAKVVKNELNIKKLREDLKLIKVAPVVDEIDVVMNNVNKMEGLMRKKDIDTLRKVAKTVIREDILANKNMVYENNPLTTRIRKVYEKKGQDDDDNNKINDEDAMETLAEQEKAEMIRLFKNDKPDFCNEEYLAHLIKRIRSLKVK